jgi:hypothetical protein
LFPCSVISVHLTSAKAVTGISGFAASMQRQRQVHHVFHEDASFDA